MANVAMNDEEKIEEAQKKLEWAVSYTNEGFRPKVTAYDLDGDLAFSVEFWEKEHLLLAVNIPRSAIDDCNPKEKYLPGYLRGLFREVKRAKAKGERG
jgi:hypothetical protein